MMQVARRNNAVAPGTLAFELTGGVVAFQLPGSRHLAGRRSAPRLGAGRFGFACQTSFSLSVARLRIWTRK